MDADLATMAQSRRTHRPSSAQEILHRALLRPTRQRLALVPLLRAGGGREVSAESLYDDARRAKCSVSRATVASTLRHFERAGLVKRISLSGSRKAWFVLDVRRAAARQAGFAGRIDQVGAAPAD